MPDVLVIEFQANTDKLKEVATALDQVTTADQELGAEFKKNSSAMIGGVEELRKKFQQLQKEEAALIALQKQSNQPAIIKQLDDQLIKVRADMAAVNKETLNLNGTVGKLSGSFNRLGSVIQFGAAKKQFDEFGKAINEATSKGVRLTTQLRELKNQMSVLEQQGKQNTKQFTDLAIKTGKLQDQIGDTSRRVQILASDSRGIDFLTASVTGLAGGFSLVQGATALLGNENEDLQKSLLKVQASMAILNGLQAVNTALKKDDVIRTELQVAAHKAYAFVVGTSTGALKVFRIALAATGIGLLIIGLIALVENFDRIKASITGGVTPAMRELAIEKQKLTEGAEKLAEASSLEERRLRALGATDTEILIVRIRNINAYILALQGQRKIEQLILDEQVKSLERQEAIIDRRGVDDKRADKREKILKFFGFGSDEEVKESLAKVNEINAKIEEERVRLLEANAELLENGIVVIADEFNNLITFTAGSLAFFNKAVSDANKALQEAPLGSKAYIAALENLKTALVNAAQAQIAFDKSLERPIDEIAALPTEQKEIPAPEETVEGISAIEIEEFKTKVQKEQEKVREDSAKESAIRKAETDKELAQAIFDTSVQFANQLFDFTSAINDRELVNLQEKFNKGLISQKQYDKAVAEIKKKQAVADKAQAAFNIIISTATAIAKVAEQTGILAVVLGAVIAALGAAQLATVLAQPIPKFAKGTEAVKGGQQGKDSVMAMLMPGERIVPTDVNKQLSGIPNKELPKLARLKTLMDEMPGLNFDVLEKIKENGGGRFNFDYQLMATEFGRELKKHPQHFWTIDRHGIGHSVKEDGNYTKYADDRYFS